MIFDIPSSTAMKHWILLVLLCFICDTVTFFADDFIPTRSGERFQIRGNVTCSGMCKFPEGGHLMIRIENSCFHQEELKPSGSFPASFTITPYYSPGILSAKITRENDKVLFYTINPTWVDALNESTHQVILNVTSCPLITCKCPYGFLKDKNGCRICKCIDPCSPSPTKISACAKNLQCFVHEEYDWFNGRQFVPHCLLKDKNSKKSTRIDSKCKPLRCKCPYGFLKNRAGCDVCKCYDPCRDAKTGKRKDCGKNKKCFVDKECRGYLIQTCKYEARCATKEENKRYNLLKDFKIEGTVISSGACKNPLKTGSLYISLNTSEGYVLDTPKWATSFPVQFTLENIGTINSSVSAKIVDQDQNVTFITDDFVHVSALNGKIARVTIKIRANSTDQATTEACETCASTKCSKQCTYGLVEKKGCKICQCQDPCNEENGKTSVCPKDQQCSIISTCDLNGCRFTPECSLHTEISTDSTKVQKMRIEGGYPRMMQKLIYEYDDLIEKKIDQEKNITLEHDLYIENQSSKKNGKLDFQLHVCIAKFSKLMGVSSRNYEFHFDNAAEQELEEFARNDPWVKAGLIKEWKTFLNMFTYDTCEFIGNGGSITKDLID